jgi:hypothetical protein
MTYYEMDDKINNLIQETENRQIICSPSTVLGKRCLLENVPFFSFTVLGTIYDIIVV